MSSTASPRRVLLALGVTVGSFSTLQSLLVPVLPVMQRELHTDTAGITWALTAWLITAAVATPVFGRVGDLIGKRRVLLLSVAAVAVGSLIAALAPNLGVLLGARVLQGLGAAMFPLSFGLLRDTLPRERVAPGIGVIAALIAIGGGIGTVLAGPLAEVLTWRGLFLVPLLGSAVGAVLVLRFVPDSGMRAPGRINIPAALLLSAGLVALLLPLSLGGAWGWGSPLVIGLFAAAVLLLGGWVAVELRSREPLVDMRMMRLPGVWNTNVASILVGVAMFGGWTFLARLLQEPVETGYGLGLTVGEAGLVMLPMLALMAVVGFFIGLIGRVLSSRRQLVVGALLIAAGDLGIALLHSSVVTLATAGAAFGLGLGIATAAMTNIIVQSVPATQTGVATGMSSNLRTIGSGIGTALMTAIVTGSTGAIGEPTESGYVLGFVVLAIAALAAAGVAVLARPTHVHETASIPVAESPALEPEAA